MNAHGDFIWYELVTPDPEAAARFYEKVLPWTVEAPTADPVAYRTVRASEGHVGGFLQLSQDMADGGGRPVWLGYVGVDDVDATVAAALASGGRAIMPAQDMPGVGRLALLADPDGAPFYVMRGASDQSSNAFAADRPMQGHCAWNELSARDPDAAKAFYGGLFGWVADGDMDMGPLGKYEFLRSRPGEGHMLGAVMPMMPQQPAPAWTAYFRVAEIDAAAEAIRSNGGTLIQEPIEIPGGEFSLVAADPHGAVFGLVGPRA